MQAFHDVVLNFPLIVSQVKSRGLGLEKEEHRLHKSWLDIEHEESNLTDNKYRNDQRSTNQQISRLGDDLWKHNQSLRPGQEKLGVRSTLGPDSKGLLVNTLLVLYNHTFCFSKAFHRVTVRNENFYFASVWICRRSPEGKLWCPIFQTTSTTNRWRLRISFHTESPIQ